MTNKPDMLGENEKKKSFILTSFMFLKSSPQIKNILIKKPTQVSYKINILP